MKWYRNDYAFYVSFIVVIINCNYKLRTEKLALAVIQRVVNFYIFAIVL